MPYVRVGKCVYKQNPDKSRGEKKGCSATVDEAKAYMRKLYSVENKSMAEFSMAITKASIPDKKSRAMRLSMVTSDTGEDVFDEKMSLELFNDFVERINDNTPVPEPFDGVLEDGWNGGMPYPSISHYRSANGANVPGEIERVYVDGDLLKANAVLNDTPLGMAVWKSVCQDMEERNKTLEEKTFPNPVRVSIGFLDLQHKHTLEGGDYIFTRSSLDQKCEKCAEGANHKVYLKGQLVHLAFTRVPANPRTSVEVMRMSDEILTKKDDAESIIGDLAEELVGKSTVEEEPEALVVKSNDNPDDEEAEGRDQKKKKKDAAMQKSTVDEEPELVEEAGRKDVSPADKKRAEKKYGNVTYADPANKKYPIDTPEHIHAAWRYINMPRNSSKYSAAQVRAIKSRIAAAWRAKIDKAGPPSAAKKNKSEAIMTEEMEVLEETQENEELSPIDEAVEKFRTALIDLQGKGNSALEELQPLFNELGDVAKSVVYNPAEQALQMNRSMVQEEIAKAVPEIVAQIVKSMPAAAPQPVAQPKEEIPTPRSLVQKMFVPQQQNKEMTTIEKLAFNSTVGVATGQHVD